MVTRYLDYEIHITPRWDIIATKMMSGGLYESFACYEGEWDKTPPDDIKEWYDRFSGRVTV